MKTKIQVRQLDLYYGAFKALHQINLDIPENKITAIIGPSGCGKSTFLRTLNRMNDLIPGVRVTGEIIMDGQNLFELNVVDLRKRIGMVFQRPNPFPKSIFDNVAYGPRIHGTTNREELHQIVEQSLKAAALWDEVKNKLDKSSFDLSSGEQQRLCIARAIAIQPEVILMDEPASALDPIATLKIEELIRILSQNYTIVIVTHNMQQAARVSDYTAFFHMQDDGAGYLVEYNQTQRIFTTPKEILTEHYITGRFG